MNQRLATVSRKVSLQTYYVHRQLRKFSGYVGRCSFIVDVGAGESSPYKDLFDADMYVGLDRFEHADVVGDASALPFPSTRVDLVLCTEVLEHLPIPHVGLSEMNRVLAPGGFLVLTTPLLWGEHDHVDYQRWTEAGLRAILHTVGFEVQEVKRRGGIFTMLGSMITHIPNQVFGTWDAQRNWLLRMLYVGCWLITIPIPWLMALFDPFDRTRAFTTGFSVLCRKPIPSDECQPVAGRK
jgi:SAM-dependent methyltransferase